MSHCQHSRCREDARESAIENFEEDKGFSFYDLPATYDEVAETEAVTWYTITRETDFKAADRYFWTVADMYLEEGTVTCLEDR